MATSSMASACMGLFLLRVASERPVSSRRAAWIGSWCETKISGPFDTSRCARIADPTRSASSASDSGENGRSSGCSRYAVNSPGNDTSNSSHTWPAQREPSVHSVKASSTTTRPSVPLAMICPVSTARLRGEVTTVALWGRRLATSVACRRPVAESGKPGRSAYTT